MINRQQFNEFDYNILGKNSKFKGDIVLQGFTTILCHYEGTLSMADKAQLTLERGSYFEGTLNCHDVEIFSAFKGTINATGRVVIRSNANVSGSINCQKMTIYPGATVNINAETAPAITN